MGAMMLLGAAVKTLLKEIRRHDKGIIVLFGNSRNRMNEIINKKKSL